SAAASSSRSGARIPGAGSRSESARLSKRASTAPSEPPPGLRGQSPRSKGADSMQFGLMLRAQFPEGDDMTARFQELLEQARLAHSLGFDSITKGMHYSSPPWQSLQQLPFLSRVMAEAPRLRLNFGLILLSLP